MALIKRAAHELLINCLHNESWRVSFICFQRAGVVTLNKKDKNNSNDHNWLVMLQQHFTRLVNIVQVLHLELEC